MGNSLPKEEVKDPEEEAHEAASVIQNQWKKKEEQGFKWPENLYVELIDMLETEQLAGYAALLFQAAREIKNPLKGLEAIVGGAESAPESGTEKPKLTLAQIQSIMEDNKEALGKTKAFADTSPENALEVLNKISNHTSNRKLAIVALNPSQLQKEDMPYAIVKDDKLKRITVVFTANNSALKDEWILQRAYRQRNVKLFRALKAKISGDRITHVKVHEGFSLYLTKGGENSLGNQIVNDLLPLLEAPKYKLYATGHGSAGALACLFAFQMAFDANISMPVSCINFGAPRVGDGAFWRASYLLEISGKLRICRIVTDNDTLPTIPASKDYAHAGYQLKLTTDASSKPQEYYPAVKDDGSLRKGAFQSTKKFNASKSDQQTYMSCIEANKTALTELDLNVLYKQAGVEAFSTTEE